MRIVRALGVRAAIFAVALVVMAVGWGVNTVMRYQARGDAQKTTSWFYSDTHYENFAQFVSSSESYLAPEARADQAGLESAFGTLDRDDFANEFDGDGLLAPDTLAFKVNTIVEQDNDGQLAHMLVTGQIRPDEMKRGKTKYQFSDDTYEPFTHLVTLAKSGGSWYVAGVEPQN